MAGFNLSEPPSEIDEVSKQFVLANCYDPTFAAQWFEQLEEESEEENAVPGIGSEKS